jgi:anaerobic selenocysteine-containing dehydrogenase
VRQATINTSPKVSDEVKETTCYMCACRCGIRVHLRDGALRYIEGNPNHPVNRGVLCAKGAAGIMKQHSPAKLTKPLKRVGARGKGEFVEIEWAEALEIATGWLGKIRETDPKKLAFFTGRDQSQALTGWWATQFGTPNYAAHGGFCSVNMAAAGLYTMGGSFWEFGEPDWDQTRYFMMFGVAEDHASNPIKIGLGKVKANGAKFVSVNPVRTGYSAIADEWVGIRPGTDGLLVFSLIRELLLADQVDFDYLARYTNAGWLVVQDDGAADDGLFVRDDTGNVQCWDKTLDGLGPVLDKKANPALIGVRKLPDGRDAIPAFELLARRFLDPAYAPEAVADRTGLEADTIRRLAAELAHAAFQEEIRVDVAWTDFAGRRHNHMIGRPVSFHAMRGISAHSNGFHTCRALHVLQALLGSIDCPGGWRYRPPYPKAAPPAVLPTGPVETPGDPLAGPPLGFPRGPEDLLVDEAGGALRIDKAFSWDAPLAAHGMMHMLIRNAWAGDPYPIDTLFMFMANMSWNSSMNTTETMRMLTDKDVDTGEYKIPHIIYSDAFDSEMVAFADLVLPDTTYLERWDCISLLDRPISETDGPADSIRQPILTPDRDVRPFQDVLLDLGARLGLPGMVDDNGEALYPGGLPDYLLRHERKPGVGMLAGWRGTDGASKGIGEPNPEQLEKYVANGCFWSDKIPEEARYFRNVNQAYRAYGEAMGFLDTPDPVIVQLYSEVLQKFRLAAQGHGATQPPEAERQRVAHYFDPLPMWYMPFEEATVDRDSFPLHALTQRPMMMYHSWDSQNAWQRQILGSNRLYLARTLASRLDIEDDDWVWVSSHQGRIRAQVRLMDGVNPDTVWTWNAIGKRKGTWGLDPDAHEATRGFLLNHLIGDRLPESRHANADPVTGQAAWFDLRVKIEKVTAEGAAESWPQFDALPGNVSPGGTPAILKYGVNFRSGQ